MSPDQHRRLEPATRELDPPVAVLDLDALDGNADDLVRRAAGRPIRVASKSVRCRAVLRRVLARPGFSGVLAYALPEALWLAGGRLHLGVRRSPVRDAAGAAALRIGGRVWFRHAKAGELCEHVDALHVLDGDALTGAWPTYRGEGRAFG
jgi:D-serine deaminase-like pyridoxal phosphate-dependent protein